ncbi:hypothetical protein PS051_18610 [Escherichia albertii]|uniref:hypothetical protein n=2 Tax=Escherichia albertii TaxID=208962 RepID=UPI0023615132|nr:hypothetical protein [Escherichia albertii]MCZ8879686.1 hypothetical protein [Escherichia albertii]WDB87494.1 hypothetical protein PS051_18610 [Escherichia albertii]
MSDLNHGFDISNGIAATKDIIRVISFPDYDRDPWESDYSQIGCYKKDVGWGGMHRFWYATSLCMSIKTNSSNDRVYVILGREGQVEFYTPNKTSVNEFILDTGLYQSWSKNYGYVMCIKEIGQHLYVCGDNNQVYRRSSTGNWEHIDHGIFQELSPENWTFLSDIDGLSENDIYAVGYKGALYHYNGQQWSHPHHNVDNEKLTKICIKSEDVIYVVGDNGTILIGNYKDGFKDISAVNDINKYTDIVYFGNSFYLASNKGMFTLDPLTNIVKSYHTDLDIDLRDTHKLSVKDGVLWSIGNRDIAWFDGQHWTRVDIPGNPKIGGK